MTWFEGLVRHEVSPSSKLVFWRVDKTWMFLDVLVQVLMVWFDLVYSEWIAMGRNTNLADGLSMLAVGWLQVSLYYCV